MRTGTRLPAMHLTIVDGVTVAVEDLVQEAPGLPVPCPGVLVPLEQDAAARAADLVRTPRGTENVDRRGLGEHPGAGDAHAGVRGRPHHDPVPAVRRGADAIGTRDTRGALWYDRFLFGAPRQDIAMLTSIVLDRIGCVVDAYRSTHVYDLPPLRAHQNQRQTPAPGSGMAGRRAPQAFVLLGSKPDARRMYAWMAAFPWPVLPVAKCIWVLLGVTKCVGR